MKDSSTGGAVQKFSDPGELPRKALVLMMIAAFALGLLSLSGLTVSALGALLVLLTDGLMAMFVLVAAGGYGYAVFRRLAPKTPPLLALATSAAVGLWLLSTAMMIVGSAIGGALTGFVWWPVIGGGVVLALVQGHKAMGAVSVPRKFRGGALVWVLVAAGAGMWLAGAAMPPGLVGGLTMDVYDVLEYHLQLPREYYEAGSISTLTHNVYSHYPLGSEMLYLLGMCLRGGPHAGAYLAQLMNGMFAIVAVVGVFGALREDDDFAARATIGVLATAPVVLYFSWIAMAEMSQFCYLALGLVWLREWLRQGGGRCALWLGAMAGAACAMKYLSVGLIAGPLLVVMLAVSVRNARRIGQFGLAVAMTAALFAPWLVRNAAATGNPVFPLATKTFGAGHWSAESAQRWRNGHSPRLPTILPETAEQGKKPVKRQLSRREAAARLLGGMRPYHDNSPLDPAHLLVILAIGTLVAMFRRPRATPGWDWALAAVLVMQFVIWAWATHDMPARFISVAIVPLAMLVGRGLSRLSHVKELRLGRLKQSAGIGGRWGLAPAGLLLVAISWTNLLSARASFSLEIETLAKRKLIDTSALPMGMQITPPPEEGLALIGDATAFRFPPRTLYATVFDTHPLEATFAESRSSDELAARLREMGVREVRVRWPEIGRLAATYGWPEAMTPDRLRRLLALCPSEDLYSYRTDEKGHLVKDEKGNPIKGGLILTVYTVPSLEPPATQPK